MKIAIDIRSLLNPHQTGVGQFTSGLLQALNQYTDHTYLLYYNAAKQVMLPDAITDIGTNVVTRVPNKLMTATSPWLNMPKIDRAIRKHTGTSIDMLYSPNIQYAPHTRHMPHIMTIHDLSFVHFPEYYTRKQQVWHAFQQVSYQLQHAAAVIVPSESTKDDVVRTYDISEDRVHVVYPGVQEQAFVSVTNEQKEYVRQTYQLPNQFFLFLGTIEPRKNIDTLLEAYAYGKFAEQGIDLVIAGAAGWQSAETFQTIERMNGVRYIGYVHEAEKAALYALATACVYPSLYEGFGFPVLEAMAQGTPVITSNRTSLPEITQGQVRYVHPYRVDELTDALREYVDGIKDDRLVALARGYTWEGVARGMDRVFCDIFVV